MSAIVYYNFAEQTLGNGDQLKLTVAFTDPLLSSTVFNTPSTENVFVADYGSQEWEYDLDKFLIVPGLYNLKISAPSDSSFAKYFFSNETAYYQTPKEADVTLEIKYNGNEDFEIEFVGKVSPKTLKYNPDTTYITFTAAPNTDIINKTLLYDGATPINPFGYSLNELRPLSEILEDIYKLVDNSISYAGGTLVIHHDWLMQCFRPDTAEPPNLYYLSDVPFAGNAYYRVNPLYFDDRYALLYLGDLLKKLAVETGSFTGMVTGKKAFFKKLFSYDEADVYDIAEDEYSKFDYAFNFDKVDYVRITAQEPNWAPSSSVVYVQPPGATFPNIEGKYIDLALNTFVGGFTPPPPLEDVYTLWTSSGGYAWAVYALTDPAIGASLSNGDIISQLWYNWRGNSFKSRMENITAHGLDHSIIKNPRFNGKIYQPTYLRKKYMDCKTEMRMLPLE